MRPIPRKCPAWINELAEIGQNRRGVLQRWRDQGGPCADAEVVFVCHSMGGLIVGGLIARWHIETLGGAEVTRKLITPGTPYRGAALAPGPARQRRPPRAWAAPDRPDQVRPQHSSLH